MGLLTLLPLLGFSLFLARSARTEHSVALLHAVALIVLVLYVGALAQILWWAALSVHLVGVCLLGYETWRLAKRAEPLAIPTPYGLLLLFSGLFLLIHGSSQYLYYDEYAHWGVYLKEMLAFDGFWHADTNAMHPRYPPAAPLWQYLFNAFRELNEGTAYLAQFVLVLTPLLVLWDRLEWRRVPWLLAILSLCLLALTDFGLGVSSLYVDPVISVWFIGTILCYVLDSPTSVPRIALYALPLAMIALIKESSLEFSFAAAGILTTLGLFQNWQALGSGRARVLRSIAVLALIGGPPILCAQVWQWNRDRIGAPADLEAVGGIVSAITGHGAQADPDQGAELTGRFFDVFLHQQLSNDAVSRQFNAFSYPLRSLFTDRFRLTTLSLFAIFALWWVVLVRFVLTGPSRWAWSIVTCGVALTATGYVAALYLSYRAAGEYGLMLSSYLRYVHTVALPMLVVCFAPLLPVFRTQGSERLWRIAGRPVPAHASLVVFGLVSLYLFETPYLRPILQPNPGIEIRRQLEPVTKAIHDSIGRSSLWVYLPNDRPNGFVGQLLQYLLAPTPTFVERADTFLERDPQEILDCWAQFQYVWLAADLTPEATDRFFKLVGKKSTTRLYRVGFDSTGETELSPVISE